MAANGNGKRAGKGMTQDHKAALARGRELSRNVSAYLEALESHAPKRGRKRTPESVTKRLAAIEAEWATASSLRALLLAQERRDLEAELASMNGSNGSNRAELESAFIASAAEYAQSKGVSYAAFREVGVPADVLKRAGISRSG